MYIQKNCMGTNNFRKQVEDCLPECCHQQALACGKLEGQGKGSWLGFASDALAFYIHKAVLYGAFRYTTSPHLQHEGV